MAEKLADDVESESDRVARKILRSVSTKRSTFLPMRRAREFDCILWLEAGVWTAHSPAVPGVYGLGRTRSAAERDLADGLDDLFTYLEDIGERQPLPRRIAVGNRSGIAVEKRSAPRCTRTATTMAISRATQVGTTSGR